MFGGFSQSRSKASPKTLAIALTLGLLSSSTTADKYCAYSSSCGNSSDAPWGDEGFTQWKFLTRKKCFIFYHGVTPWSHHLTNLLSNHHVQPPEKDPWAQSRWDPQSCPSLQHWRAWYLDGLDCKTDIQQKNHGDYEKKIWNLFEWKIQKLPTKVSFFCCVWHVLVDVLVQVSQNKLNQVVFSSSHPGMKKTRIKTLLCIGQSSFMTDTGCISQSLGCLTTSEAMMCFFTGYECIRIRLRFP